MKATNEGNWQMLRGLFPKWDSNEHEARLYRKAFASRRADLMQTAIEDFRTYHKYLQPNLGGILKEYSRLHNDLNRGKAPAHDAPGVDEEAEAEEVRQSRARVLLELEMMAEGSIEAVRAEIASVECLAAIMGRIKGPVSGWTDTARGLVWAKANEMGLTAGSSLSTQPPSRNPDPE